jgi:hypothetical protein
MVAAQSFAGWRCTSHQVRRSTSLGSSLIASLTLLAACSEHGLLEPVASPRSHATVVVTPDYSTFDTRTELNAAGTIDHLGTFEEFSGELVYMPGTPWTNNGVTYTSALNIVFGPGVGLGVASNSMSTEFGDPLTLQLASDDAYTTFGVDLTTIGTKLPVSVLITTNLGSYAFNDLDVPLATTGRRFFGIALSKPGEHLTDVRFTVPSGDATVLLDDVAVGHVSAAHNADPKASAGGPYVAKKGSSVTLALSATDADSDPLTYTWDLGDGTTGSGSTPPASHTYVDNGSYDVMLAVADGRGGVDTARTKVMVYDPDGWVTGGGWVSSPAGAYAASSMLTGKLTFSLTVKYQTGASAPSGTFEAKMSSAKLEFRATSFEWLVIDGAKFSMVGRGTINGGGDYAFSVSGEDGASEDSIRICVWNRATGVMAYDNRAGSSAQGTAMALLGGGSLQVH